MSHPSIQLSYPCPADKESVLLSDHKSHHFQTYRTVIRIDPACRHIRNMVFPGLQILIRINSQDFKLVVPDPLRHKRRSSKLVRNLLTGMAIRIIEKQEQIIGFRVVQSPFLAVRQRVREIRCRFSHPVLRANSSK